MFLARIKVYISMGWDKKLLKDPSGDTYEKKRKESLNEEQNLIEKILETENVINKENWTVSLHGIPVITHSIVENYFAKAEGKRHLLEGYAFSKTKKFETSGKRIEINVFQEHNMFLLRGYRRAAMKQTKQDETYKICVLFDRETGEILGARGFSCAARRRGFANTLLPYRINWPRQQCPRNKNFQSLLAAPRLDKCGVCPLSNRNKILIRNLRNASPFSN